MRQATEPETARRLSPQGIDAVLFDLDGTLIETDNRWAASLADRLAFTKRVHPSLDVDSLARALVMSVEVPSNYVLSLLEHLGLGPTMERLTNRVRRSKGVAVVGEELLVDGSRELLEALGPRYELAVVTTRARQQATAILTATRLESYFEVVITRSDVWRMKPHPAPVLAAASQLGIAVDRCAFVGDTIMDVRAAQRAGAVSVAVLSGFGGRRELERCRPDLLLAHAYDLLGYLAPELLSTS